jgi:putative FmdB family regulatory protein
LPIYEYECPRCGVFEVMQKITDEPLQQCPRCKRKVKKLISESSFQLKGTGWYATDYAQKGKGDGKDSKDKKGVDLSRESKESGSKSAESAESGAGKDSKEKAGSSPSDSKHSKKD